MTYHDDLPHRPLRSRGFSPPAAIGILVGVTALSVVGSLGLGMALIPTPQAGAAQTQPADYPDDVLISPVSSTPAAPAPAAPAVEESASPAPAAAEPATERPSPRARPRPTSPSGGSDAASVRQASRDDLGLEDGDPLGPISFDRIEG